MSITIINVKNLHFKSIVFFSKFVIKYFNPIVNKILIEVTENYEGMEMSLTNF